MPYWSGNNGGATYHGVTGSEIKIASGNCSDSASANHDPAYQRFLDSRFELYGRKLVEDCSQTFPAVNVVDAPTNRADADNMYAAGFFGSLYDSSPAGSVYYYSELAAKHMIVSSAEYGWAPEWWLRQNDPYIVQYEQASDRMFANIGEWACAWLQGRPPSHAGPVLAAAKERKFGIYFSRGNADMPTTSDALHQQLADCGITVAANDDIEYANSGPNDTTVESTAVRFNSDHVTTVFCLANDDLQCPTLMNSAVGQSYYPEWIMSTYGINDRNWAFKVFGAPETELQHAFGLTFTPRQIPTVDEPWWWAAHEGDPTLPNTGEDEISWQNSLEYHSWLMLAAGVQMAGPHLTAASFMRGLQAADFPNPTSPYMEGAVSLNGGNHFWTQDAAVWWWSPSAKSPYSDEQAGTVCYVNHGTRTPAGAWRKLAPGDDPLFAAPCDSG